MPAFDAALVDAAQRSAAWPFEEARKLVARIEKSGKKTVIFETGYDPSGLPHLGTFGEVARTSMVRHAFQVLTGNTIPTRLIAFSDDMDGLRKVPDNVPNKELLAANLGNTPQADGDGYLYRGRGYVQITGARNYRLATSRLGVDLVGSPDKALDPAIAAKIIIRGMIEGWFTGKKLSDYIGAKVDYKGARRIVNGTDKAALIAGYADTIEAALRAAGADKPAPAKPEIIVMQPASPQPARNPIAAFFAALFGWLNVDK